MIKFGMDTQKKNVSFDKSFYFVFTSAIKHAVVEFSRTVTHWGYVILRVASRLKTLKVRFNKLLITAIKNHKQHACKMQWSTKFPDYIQIAQRTEA